MVISRPSKFNPKMHGRAISRKYLRQCDRNTPVSCLPFCEYIFMYMGVMAKLKGNIRLSITLIARSYPAEYMPTAAALI